RYLIARKMESIEGFSYHMAVKEYWHTNCTGNRHCDICFKEYMELKQKPEVESDIYT
ncbi:6918_t:CDS:2, partial [Dentiscutata heterogama]